MIKDGDAKEGRSANSVQCCNEDKDLAIAYTWQNYDAMYICHYQGKICS